MKKIILVLVCLFFICGCANINSLSIDNIIDTVSENNKKPNTYRTGYKYYLPKGMGIENSEEFNETLFDGYNYYYLYVDGVSYMKKIKKEYTPNDKSYVSKTISNGKKYGYLEINLLENNKYLIEIMYNYAKIEVMVEESEINRALLTSINLLKSIKYNDNIINNIFGKDILNYLEEEFNIFHTTSSDSTYIQIDDTYYEEEVEMPDTDLIS